MYGHPITFNPKGLKLKNVEKQFAFFESQQKYGRCTFSSVTNSGASSLVVPLEGPKHDQVESGFFYTNQTHMVR
jgi:hypothetical protein